MVWTPGTPVQLATEHFLMRSLRPEDVGDRYVDWWSDPDAAAENSGPGRAEMLDKHRQRIANNYDNRKAFHLGIFDRKEDLIVGFITVFFNTYHRSATINFLIGDRDYWGRNVMRELSGPGFEFIFGDLQAEKITGRIAIRNFSTIYLARAVGLKMEGVLKKEFLLQDGGRTDVVVFGLLRDDWKKRGAEKTA